MNVKLDQSFANLERALGRLNETRTLDRDANPLLIDGTIQRFEFTIELFWKTLKRLLEYEGIEGATPREALKQAYAAKWLHDEQLWLDMLRDRNRTSHVYDEEAAGEIFENIQRYLPELNRAFAYLSDVKR